MPLSVVGVVPVKVSAENGTILGKALGSLARGTGIVKVLIILQ